MPATQEQAQAAGTATPSVDATAWVAAVSHDLREPMNVILGMTRLLLETRLDDAQRGYAEAVEDAASGMLTLVNDLLDVNRLQRGDLTIANEPFDLTRLLGRCIELARPRVASEAVTLRLEREAGTPDWVSGDAGRLRQILVNLLVNALKSTPAGEVVLTTAPAGPDRTAFTVADTGRGLAADEVEHLFGSAGHAGPATVGKGGLGLAIVRLLAARLGGTLGVESAPDQGTRITVELPLVPAPAEVPARRFPIAGCHVWVAGGSAALRQSTARALDSLGPDVRTLDDTELERALADDVEELPDALLLVAAVPDEATATTAAALRARRADLVLLAVGGSGLRGEAEVWREAGFDAYLPHPASAEVIADALAVLSGTVAPDRQFTTAHSLVDRSMGSLDILAVDDNPLNLRLVVILLERAGHRVAVAEDGAAAVQRVAAGGIDAVMMDVQMPGMDGLEATRRIRALGTAAARVPIIAVTANAQRRHLDACRSAGMDAVVTKPIDASTLLATLSEAVAVG